jgi:hypothetical protein
MDFLSNLQTDVKLLLVAGALALLAALLSGTKRNEHRYMALFTLVMLAAGWRFHVHEQAEQQAQGRRGENTVVHSKSSVRPSTR